MTFADKLIELRRLNSLSQEGLAEKLDVSRQAVSRWETGAAMPDAQNLLQMSKIFGVTVDFLLNDEYQSDKDIPIVSTTEKSIPKERKQSNRQYYSNAILISTAIMTLLAFIIFTARGCLEGYQTFILPLFAPLPLLFLAIFHHELLSQKSVLIISLTSLAIASIIVLIGCWINLNYFHNSGSFMWAYMIEYYTSSAFWSLSFFIPFLSIKRKWWLSAIIFISSALISFAILYICYTLISAIEKMIYLTPNFVTVIVMLISETAFIISWYFCYSEGKRKIEKM